MEDTYRQQVYDNAEKTAQNLLYDAPDYLTDYYNHLRQKKEVTTQLSYVRDLIDFLDYRLSVDPDLKGCILETIPIDDIIKLTYTDINNYSNYLHDERKLKNPSVKKKLAALSSFFKFLIRVDLMTKNPMAEYDFPKINKPDYILKLSSLASEQLLDGILRNDRYLHRDDDGDVILPISPEVKIKRERLVLRNYAIVYLFLGTGLRVSELVGIDINDLDLKHNVVTVTIKGGNKHEVSFNDEVASALSTYLETERLPPTLSQKYFSNPELRNWCSSHIADDNLEKSIKAKFPDIDDETFSDVVDMVDHYRRHGRSGFKPASNNDALFLSTRGTRITVRMVEIMVKEMIMTYCDDAPNNKDKFSPHKLRATCATRILDQTGNLELASRQLNHQNISTTSTYYADLEKDKQRKEIGALSVKDW